MKQIFSAHQMEITPQIHKITSHFAICDFEVTMDIIIDHENLELHDMCIIRSKTINVTPARLSVGFK